MKKLITICAVVTMVLAVSGVAQAEVTLSNIDKLWHAGSGFAGESRDGLVFKTGSSASSIDGLSFSLLNGSDLLCRKALYFPNIPLRCRLSTVRQ